MPALTGILLDVSGSMRRSVGGPVDQEGGSWVRSIFRVVNQLIKHDLSSENQVFALGVGANKHPHIFDLLNTIKEACGQFRRTKSEVITDILHILKGNGARYVEDWASLDMLLNNVSEWEAKLLLTMFEKNPGYIKEFVEECLPIQCRKKGSTFLATVVETLVKRKLPGFIDGAIETASIEAIRETVYKGMKLFQKSEIPIVDVDGVVNVGGERATVLRRLKALFELRMHDSITPIVSVQEASYILHVGNEEESLTKHQVDRLEKLVEPLIYGRTPLIGALHEAKKLMSMKQYENHKKVLFVLSDGEPTDGDTPPDLSHLNVHVVSCYITNFNISDPKHLYSSKCHKWYTGAKFMFDLSSPVTTQQLPRTIFVKRGWKIDFDNNKTKLFLQVNHPDLIDEVCAFARDVVCCQDSLSDVLASINLDLYINKVNQGFKVNKQKGTNSDANAAATVLHLAMKRIVGRERGYPDFFHLLEELTARFRDTEEDTLAILQVVCYKNDLRCKEVKTMGALEAVTEKRPVIALFCLTDSEFDEFDDFYKEKPRGTLSKKDLDLSRRSDRSKTRKHGAVLTSFNGKGLTLMNSRGSNWANNGFFSVENADVLGLKFVDVYWTQADLQPSEIEYFEREGPRTSQMLIERLQGLQNATYKCPACKQESDVRKFTGRIVEATCPKCSRVFNTNDRDAHDLVLNMYLTSLVTED